MQRCWLKTYMSKRGRLKKWEEKTYVVDQADYQHSSNHRLLFHILTYEGSCSRDEGAQRLYKVGHQCQATKRQKYYSKRQTVTISGNLHTMPIRSSSRLPRTIHHNGRWRSWDRVAMSQVSKRTPATTQRTSQSHRRKSMTTGSKTIFGRMYGTKENRGGKPHVKIGQKRPWETASFYRSNSTPEGLPMLWIRPATESQCSSFPFLKIIKKNQ